MRLIGGLLFADPAQSVTPERLRIMARGDGAGVPVCLGKGRVGLFGSFQVDGIESTDQVWSVSDLDLTNLPELRALTGRLEGGLLAALYALEGARLVDRLRGGFALALWDRRERRLLLGVDRFGIKRLYYVTTSEGFAFASRPAALLAAPGVERTVDPTAAYHYLSFGFVPAPHSIYAGVRRIPPGHVLVVRDREAVVTRYWDLTYPERPIGVREGAATTYRLVQEAVALAARGTAPKETGSFLSGGTDSSTVVGLMGQVTGERVNAFSVGFQEPRYNELQYAELAARHFHAAHHSIIVTPEEAFKTLPCLVRAYDEPFGNDSTIPAYLCAKLASNSGMTRLLAGDGGDELFGGNERYRIDRIFAAYDRIPRWLRQAVVEPLLSGLPDGRATLLGRAQRYVRRARLPNPRRFYSYECFMAEEAARFLDPEFVRLAGSDTPWRLVEAYFDQAKAASELNRLLYLDIKLTIGDNDLLKVTRTAELAGIEVRFPMLDHSLAEFTGSLPAHYKVNGLEKRYLFKRAFRSLLPPEILAKRKHGFGLPVSDWLRTHPGLRELARDSLLSGTASTRVYFRPGAIDQLFRLHEGDSSAYYGHLLWMVLMFELWYSEHGRGDAPA